MSWFKGAAANTRQDDVKDRMEAFDRSQAIIEFTIDGKIVDANKNFLDTMGYTLDEIRGQHHGMFVEPGYRASDEYRKFWESLRNGEFQRNQYKRIGKGGKEVWIQGSYNPILDKNGKAYKVVKLATDITAEKLGELANYRLKTALESCQTNVMVADDDYTITYMNNTMLEMIRAAESDMRKDVPALDVNTLIGTNIDIFHKNPAHQRKILDNLTSSIKTDLKIGGREFHLIVTPIFQEGTKERVGTVVEWKDETESRAAEKANYRLRSALDSCQTNVMVADENLNIIYMNKTMMEMMRNAEADMRKDVPALDTRTLIGTNVDVFHKNPAHQRRILDSLASPVTTDLKIGGRSFNLVVSPIADKAGKRLGTTVEWKDQTAEKAVETEVNDIVNAALAGDLTRRIKEDGKSGFMLTLAKSINGLSQNMADTLAAIKTAAQEVAQSASEISTSTTDLSQRTEEQAASLEETSASMEELAATVKKNAENAQEASKSATSTREVANRGGEVVSQAVSAMSRIEESSRKISDIIGVIDEIARQTNLLALNAAVEAARAGDAGRGFAVVASEVRSLAQRSSQAAKDIKDLINNSTGQVKDGVQLVNNAGEQLSKIVESINGVAVIVSEIANACAEQSTGIDQVNKALNQMDEVTQQNSALVEQNAATAKMLEQNSDAMNDRVSVFKLDASASVVPLKAPAPAITVTPPPAPRPKPAVKTNGAAPAGPARRMQAALATAIKDDPDWKEF